MPCNMFRIVLQQCRTGCTLFDNHAKVLDLETFKNALK